MNEQPNTKTHTQFFNAGPFDTVAEAVAHRSDHIPCIRAGPDGKYYIIWGPKSTTTLRELRRDG